MQFMPSLRHKALNQEKVFTIANTIITITNINIIIVGIIGPCRKRTSTKIQSQGRRQEVGGAREARAEVRKTSTLNITINDVGGIYTYDE